MSLGTFIEYLTCLMRVSNSTPFLATNPAVLSTMFFTSGGGWIIGISASATIVTSEKTKMMSNNFDTSLVTQGTGVRRQDTFVARVVEGGLRRPSRGCRMPRRAGRTEAAAQRQIMAASQCESHKGPLWQTMTT